MRVPLFCFAWLAVPAALKLIAAEAPAPAVHPTLTVLLSYEKPYSSPSFIALEQKLQSLLADAGVQVRVRDRQEAAPHEEFADVVVFRMKGTCSMATRASLEDLPVGALSDERGPLAMAYTADGQIQPFGEVECDHVRKSLQRVVGKGAPERYQAKYGEALGTVMAHEVYHMLSGRAEHTKAGITKESLSGREMLENRLALPEKAVAAMTPSLSFASH